jgi:hypothetical protein
VHATDLVSFLTHNFCFSIGYKKLDVKKKKINFEFVGLSGFVFSNFDKDNCVAIVLGF